MLKWQILIMCNFSPVNMKQEAPQAFKAPTTEVIHLFSYLLHEIWSWMQHLEKKKRKKVTTSKSKPKHKNQYTSKSTKTLYLDLVFINNQDYQLENNWSGSIKPLPLDTCVFQTAAASAQTLQ